MASTPRTLVPLVRLSVAVAIRPFTQTAVRAGGASPPLPPFARIPPPSDTLVENNDCVFDDGVAPELALDFDCQHISSGEGLAWWLGGMAFFTTFFYVVKSTKPEDKNPAVNHSMTMVIPDVPVGPPGKKE